MQTDKSEMPKWIKAVAAKLETANADVGRSYDNRPDAEETAQIIYAGWQAHAESVAPPKEKSKHCTYWCDPVKDVHTGLCINRHAAEHFQPNSDEWKKAAAAEIMTIAYEKRTYQLPSEIVDIISKHEPKAESLSGAAPEVNSRSQQKRVAVMKGEPMPTFAGEEGAQAPDLRPEIEKILSVAIDVRAPYAKVMIGKIVDLLAAGTGDATGKEKAEHPKMDVFGPGDYGFKVDPNANISWEDAKKMIKEADPEKKDEQN